MAEVKKFTIEKKFTETYRCYQNEHIAIREAMCLRAQYPDILDELQEGDLFAGRISPALVGFSPDEWGPTAFGYYLREEDYNKALNRLELDEEKKDYQQILDFWKRENTSYRLRCSYPREMAKAIPLDDWMNESGIAFPLYRLTGGNINFDKLMKIGIPGLYKEVEDNLNKAKEQGKDYKLYEAMLIALDLLVEVSLTYAEKARQKAKVEEDKDYKRELLDMAAVLKNITENKPNTFREALQLFWLYSLIADVRNYGRMDVYIGDFYVNDLASGKLIEEKALELLQSLWQLMADRNTRVHGRVIIGGRGRPNEENADKFALLAMEASRTVKEIEPQLSLRFYQGMEPSLMEKALDVIGEGRTFPILYNDDVNIKAVVNAFGFTEKEAEQYVPFGCGEYILEHRSFGTPSGVINLLKALEITLHNGIDPITGKRMGLQLGEFKDFKTFDELWEAYKKQVDYFVEIMADQEALEYKVAGQTAPFLYMSMLYDDCLEKGKGMFSGGIRYLGGTLETYGNTNTADSLIAIKKYVYDEKVFSQEQLLKILDNNFEGYERERQILLNAPKYGNDNKIADNMLCKVHEHICNKVRDQRERTALHSYLVVIINNSANTLMGHQTAASADGRRTTKPLANGNAPTSGYDKNGITALLNSSVKPDPAIHAGAVQNMKFSREMFMSKRDKLKALLKTYFEKGGTQAMVTVVNPSELEQAMENPEEYQDLFVRVGGFSARFVELSRDVQEEILNRTLY